MPTRIAALAVSKSFHGRTVLDAVTSFGAGERTGIIRENASGKNTLLRLFAGCEQPDQGEIVVHAEGGVGYLAQDEYAELATAFELRGGLEDALAGYRGALVVVGHNRRLRDRWRGARLDMRALASA